MKYYNYLLLVSLVYSKKVALKDDDIPVVYMDDYGEIKDDRFKGLDDTNSFKVVKENGLEYTYRKENKSGDLPLPPRCPEGQTCTNISQAEDDGGWDDDEAEKPICDCYWWMKYEGDMCSGKKSECKDECGCGSMDYGGNSSKLSQVNARHELRKRAFVAHIKQKSRRHHKRKHSH